MNPRTPLNPKNSAPQNLINLLHYGSLLIFTISLALVLGFAISYLAMLP